jgi:hypothetical protein
VPIDAVWNPETQIWTLTPTGTFELEEIVTLLRETNWLGARRFMWDMAALVEGPGSSGDLHRMIGELERLIAQWRGSRAAILATTDLHYGTARMFMSFAVEVEVEYRVFRDEPSALDWLLAQAA